MPWLEVDRQLLDRGRAVGAKPLSEYMEVRGYGDAAQWVYAQALNTDAPTGPELLSHSRRFARNSQGCGRVQGGRASIQEEDAVRDGVDSGAGQYFTSRPLIHAIVDVIQRDLNGRHKANLDIT